MRLIPFLLEKSMVCHGEGSQLSGRAWWFWIFCDFHRKIFKLSGQDGGEIGSSIKKEFVKMFGPEVVREKVSPLFYSHVSP
jgi:hypothetical protein